MPDLSLPLDGSVIPALRRGIRRAPIREQIAQRLTDLIASGLLKDGDELPPERELASLLEVSRESLRGGLQLLADRDMLEIGQGTRTRVKAGGLVDAEPAPLELGALADLTDEAVLGARLVLEPALAGLAATRIDDATLERLAGLVEAQHSFDGDPVRFQISDREFHQVIFTASGNPVLAAFAGQAYSHAYTYRRDLMQHHDGIPLAVIAHESILEALQARNADAAALAMRAHMKTVETLLAGLPEKRSSAGNTS